MTSEELQDGDEGCLFILKTLVIGFVGIVIIAAFIGLVTGGGGPDPEPEVAEEPEPAPTPEPEPEPAPEPDDEEFDIVLFNAMWSQLNGSGRDDFCDGYDLLGPELSYQYFAEGLGEDVPPLDDFTRFFDVKCAQR